MGAVNGLQTHHWPISSQMLSTHCPTNSDCSHVFSGFAYVFIFKWIVFSGFACVFIFKWIVFSGFACVLIFKWIVFNGFACVFIFKCCGILHVNFVKWFYIFDVHYSPSREKQQFDIVSIFVGVWFSEVSLCTKPIRKWSHTLSL